MLLVWTIHYFSDAQGPNAVNFTADPFISITPVAMVTVKLCDQIRNPFSMIDGVYYSNPGWYLCILLRKFYKIFPNLFDWVRLQVVISHTEDYVQFSLCFHAVRFFLNATAIKMGCLEFSLFWFHCTRLITHITMLSSRIYPPPILISSDEWRHFLTGKL